MEENHIGNVIEEYAAERGWKEWNKHTINDGAYSSRQIFSDGDIIFTLMRSVIKI